MNRTCSKAMSQQERKDQLSKVYALLRSISPEEMSEKEFQKFLKKRKEGC
jgi:hypothetical protein